MLSRQGKASTLDGVRGRVALVTGAGSARGIGYASAAILAAQGAKVALTSTTERIFQRLASLPAKTADKAAFVADLTDAEAAERLVVETERKLGPIDILVNNAGMVQTGHGDETAGHLHRLTEAQWARGLDLSLNTAFLVTRAVLPGMLRRRFGRIVQVSSVTGPLVSNPGSAAYSAAKAAMLGMSRALALEVARRGITVNCVAPGWIATASQSLPEKLAGRNTPIGRSGRPGEIGAVVAFLAAAEASYLTGQLIVVDGGNSIAEYKGAPADWY